MYSEILNSKDVESKDSKKSSNKFSQRAAAMQGGCPHSCNSSNYGSVKLGIMEIRYKALLRSRDLRPRPHLVALQRVCFFARGKVRVFPRVE